MTFRNMGVSQNQGTIFRGPHNKDYSLLGSILGSPYLGKLPYLAVQDVTFTILGLRRREVFKIMFRVKRKTGTWVTTTMKTTI